MEIEKVLIKKLSFTPNEIYSNLLKNNDLIMEKLKSVYENKCTNECYIKKILEIQDRGDISINNSETEGNCTIDVMFKCIILTLDEGYVIIDAKKIKSDSDNVIYEKPYAIIYCRKTEYPHLYENNAILYINKSTYLNGNSKILTYADVFINERLEYKYNLIFNKFEELEIKETKKLFEKYTEVYDKFIKNKNDKYIKIFTDLFYPYKNDHETKTLKENKNITIKDFIEKLIKNDYKDFENKFMVISPLLSLSTDKILIKSENKGDINLYKSKNMTMNSKYFCDLILMGKITILNLIMHISEICNSDSKYYEGLKKQITYYENMKI